MRRRGIWRLLGTTVFCALLLAVVALVSGVVERKASIVKMKPFLDKPQEYDVLFAGDSIMTTGVFPMELWTRYGIAAYNIASYGNTLPVTYWAVMNALDYASPKVVVVDISGVEKSYKLHGNSSDVHTALDCYPLSRTKLAAIEDLMDNPYAVDDDGNYYVDMKWEYAFTLGKYHSRWSELTQSDFRVVPNCEKGAQSVIGVAKPNDYDIIDESCVAEEGGGWGYVYLRRMIEVCQSRGIEVLLVNLPYPATQEQQMVANAVYHIAEEFGVHYVDFVNLDQVVDYDTDCFDAHAHINPSGARKVSDYIGRYIMDHYDVTDRRDDARYASWAADEDAYVQMKIGDLHAQSGLGTLLMLLHDERFSMMMSVSGDSALYLDDTLMRLTQNIAREHVYEEDAFCKYSNSLFPLERLSEAARYGEPYLLVVDRAQNAVLECVGAGHEAQVQTSFGAVCWQGTAEGTALSMAQRGGKVLRGVQITVVDAMTNEVILEKRFAL